MAAVDRVAALTPLVTVTAVQELELPPSVVSSVCRPVAFCGPERLSDPVFELARLCSASSPGEIGTTGPVVAAASVSGERRPEFGLYSVLFGRDSLTVADLVWEQFPELTAATVRALAPLLATTADAAADSEPGQVPHEVRDPASDEIARRISAEHGWVWPYYGSVDATPLFVLAAARMLSVWPHLADEPVACGVGRSTLIGQVAAAARWVADRVRRSPSGLIESWPSSPGSIANQVWKDSSDSYHHSDGTLAAVGSVSSVEVAARTVDALRAVERLSCRWPSERWPASAGVLASQVADRVSELWMGDWFALGFDRDPSSGVERRLEVVTSNAGWLLDSSLLTSSRAGRVRAAAMAARLFASDLLCDAGVRTLASSEVRFWPGAYHNGSVWPFDTALVARGLARHGMVGHAAALARRVVTVCEQLACFPELVAGVSSGVAVNEMVVDVVEADGFAHRLCQPPQQVQAWTVAAYLWASRFLAAGH